MSDMTLTRLVIEAIQIGNPRRVDGTFTFRGKRFAYSTYKIEPKVGQPFVRIDVKEKQ